MALHKSVPSNKEMGGNGEREEGVAGADPLCFAQSTWHSSVLIPPGTSWILVYVLR